MGHNTPPNANRKGRALGRWSKDIFITALTIALVGLHMLINAPTTSAQLLPIAEKSAAQNQSGMPDWNALSVDERRAMLSRLNDEQVRQIVAGQLDNSAKEQNAAEHYFVRKVLGF